MYYSCKIMLEVLFLGLFAWAKLSKEKIGACSLAYGCWIMKIQRQLNLSSFLDHSSFGDYILFSYTRWNNNILLRNYPRAFVNRLWQLCQRSARLSMKSRSRQLLFSLGWSRSRQPQKFPVSMSLGLDNHRISQSRWVSVSTTTEFHAPIHLLWPAGYFFRKNSMTFCKNRNNFINFGSKQGKFRY